MTLLQRNISIFNATPLFPSLPTQVFPNYSQAIYILLISAFSSLGLIEWLPSSDTLHELFKHYRFTHGIALDEELALIQRSLIKEDFYKLSIMNKLEIFEYALKKTPGDDLERILWLQSSSSEVQRIH